MSAATFSKKSPLQIYLINLISLIGVGISVVQTQHFYDVRNGTSGFKSFCNVSETMNCDLVAASPYAELLGLPLSSFAAGWFLALFFVSLLAHNRFWRRESLRASLGISIVGNLISLFYLFVMVFKVKTYCLLCMGLDGINLLALILVLTLKPEGFSEHKPDIQKWKVLFGGILGSLVIGMLLLKVLDSYSIQKSDVEELANSVLNTPPLAIQIDDTYPSFGPKTAPITIVEFSDFQCPFCRIGAFAVHSVQNRYPENVRVIFKNFPLDQACNPQVQQSAHPYACEAAKIAYCANKQGKFKQVYEQFFDLQSTFAPGRQLEIAKSQGVDANQIQGCMDSEETRMAISKDIHEAVTLGVKSTPTFFVNGHKMLGAYPPVAWSRIIDQLLKK